MRRVGGIHENDGVSIVFRGALQAADLPGGPAPVLLVERRPLLLVLLLIRAKRMNIHVFSIEK